MSSSDDPAVIQAFLARLQSDSNLAAEANSSLSSEVKIDEQEVCCDLNDRSLRTLLKP